MEFESLLIACTLCTRLWARDRLVSSTLQIIIFLPLRVVESGVNTQVVWTSQTLSNCNLLLFAEGDDYFFRRENSTIALSTISCLNRLSTRAPSCKCWSTEHVFSPWFDLTCSTLALDLLRAWAKKHRRSLLVAAGLVGGGAAVYYGFRYLGLASQARKERDVARAALLQREAEERAEAQYAQLSIFVLLLASCAYNCLANMTYFSSDWVGIIFQKM